MKSGEIAQLQATMDRMRTELDQINTWLEGQELPWGIRRLPALFMRMRHQADEIQLALRRGAAKAAAEEAESVAWRARWELEQRAAGEHARQRGEETNKLSRELFPGLHDHDHDQEAT